MPVKVVTDGILLVKIESTMGTDASPVAADACLVYSVALAPDIERLTQKLVNGSQVPGCPKTGMKKDVWTIEGPIKGAGAAGTAPELGPLLQACGHLETIDAGTDVAYTKDPSQKQTITCYLYEGGNLHKLLGAAGTLSQQLTGDLKFTYTLTGKYVAVTEASAVSAPVYDTAPCLRGYGSTTTLDGVAPLLYELSIDDGATVAEVKNTIDDTGFEGFMVTEHTPTGSIQIADSAFSTKNWRSLAVADNPAGIVLSHVLGSVAGNIVTIDAPDLILGSWSENSDEGVKTLTFPFELTDSLPGTKDSQTITFT